MFSGIVFGVLPALAFAPLALAQTYPSEVEIDLPQPSFAPEFFENPIRSLEYAGRKAMSFFGVETFARELQSIDFYGLFAKGRRFAAERIPQYQSELRRFCPADCDLPEILRSFWDKVKGITW